MIKKMIRESGLVLHHGVKETTKMLILIRKRGSGQTLLHGVKETMKTLI